jgi:hypothetical protein
MTDITDEQLRQWREAAGLPESIPLWGGTTYFLEPALRRFAELARQEEREACALECDRLRNLFLEERAHQMAVGAVECRDAIRSRTTRSK